MEVQLFKGRLSLIKIQNSKIIHSLFVILHSKSKLAKSKLQ